MREGSVCSYTKCSKIMAKWKKAKCSIIPTFGVKRGKKSIGFQFFLSDTGETCLYKRNY